MIDDTTPEDDRVVPAPEPTETVRQFLDGMTDEELVRESQEQAAAIRKGDLTPERRQPESSQETGLLGQMLGDATTLARSGYIDPETSQTRAWMTGFFASFADPMQNLDQAPGVAAVPGSVVEGAARATIQTANMIPDLVNFAAGTNLPRIDVEFDPESEENRPGMDLFTGLTQFMTYFVPIAGQASRLGKGISSVTGAGKASMRLGRNRAFTAANAIEYSMATVGAGMVTDFLAFDPAAGNLSSMVRDAGWAKDNPQLEGLIKTLDSREYVNQDDPAGYLKGRFALALEGAALGVVADFGLGKLAQGLGGATRPVREAVSRSRARGTRKAINEAGAMLLTRAKFAEDYIADGGDLTKLELHLEQNGLGITEIKKNHILPAMAKQLAGDFDADEATANRVLNMFVNAGMDPNKLFLGGRGGSSMGGNERLMRLFQDSELDARFMQAQKAVMDNERRARVTDLGGQEITADSFNRESILANMMLPRTPRVMSELKAMTRDELKEKIEAAISEGRMSRDEYHFGGYEDLVNEIADGEIVDPGRIAKLANGVRLFEFVNKASSNPNRTQYSRFKAQGEASEYGEILIGGSPHKFGDQLLPPGYGLQSSDDGRFLLIDPEGRVIPDPIGIGFTSELDVYTKFSMPQQEAGTDMLHKKIREYYGQEHQRHFRQEEGATPIIAHIRFTERTVDGERVLYIEEIQSDLYNEVQLGASMGGTSQKGIRHYRPERQAHKAVAEDCRKTNRCLRPGKRL